MYKNRPSLFSSMSTIAKNDLDRQKEGHVAFMIQDFGKKDFKEIKKVMKKFEKRRKTLYRQEELLILEKERNLALVEDLAKEKVRR